MVALVINKILYLKKFKTSKDLGSEVDFLLLSMPNLKHLKLKMKKFHQQELSLILLNFKITNYHLISMYFRFMKNLLAWLEVSFLKKSLFYRSISILFIPSKFQYD